MMHCQLGRIGCMSGKAQIAGVVISMLLIGCSTPMKVGFQWKEARDMSALCTSHTFIDLYGSEKKIVPKKYKHIFSSQPTPLDSKFEVFRKGKIGVIEIRGSTAEQFSWIVNLHSAMIPASGTMTIAGISSHYSFADDTLATVHAGFAIAVATIAGEVIAKVNELHEAGIRDVIITGHSQGGAVAHLLRAYLEHLPLGSIAAAMEFKTYSFAGPMVGNEALATEYGSRYCTNNSSFSIVNPEDGITALPLSYTEGSGFTIATLKGMMQGSEESGAVKNALLNTFKGAIEKLAGATSGPLEKKIEKAIGAVELPAYRKEWNYAPMPTRMELMPFEYPLVLKDSSLLNDKERLRELKKNADGSFEKRSLYRKMPDHFQHKPYNYYVAILQQYRPRAYRRLKVKVLPENL